MSSKHTHQGAETSSTDRPVVLIVDDEPDIARTYELWLADDYEIRLAEDGEAALEKLDDAVDVVLLDRMMPDMSGDEVLERIQEREPEPRVAMVTAVDPDFDIIEMGFDDYVTKPPTKDGLREVVEELLSRAEHADGIRRYLSLLSKREALRQELTRSELAANDEYAELEERIESMRDDLDASRDRLLDDAEFISTLRDLTGREGNDP